MLLLQFVNEVHMGLNQKNIMIAEQICTAVQVISFSSSSIVAQSPEMKDKKHYKCEAEYTKQILLQAIQGLTHCVHTQTK